MSARRPGTKPATGEPRAANLSRRRFVALAGAGLAALSAAGPATGLGAAAAAKPASKTKKPAPAAAASSAESAPAPSAQQKEFDRQRAGTVATLKTIRAYGLPPGCDLPVVFKPMREPRKGH